MTVEAASLFDKPGQPVLGATSDWTQGVLGESLAISLCLIAIAILGLPLLTGRLQVRRSVVVVLGCFLRLARDCSRHSFSKWPEARRMHSAPALNKLSFRHGRQSHRRPQRTMIPTLAPRFGATERVGVACV